MALLSNNLKEEIRVLIDYQYSNFKGWPKNTDVASTNWSKCFYNYFFNLSLPIAGSTLTTLTILKETFKTNLKVKLDQTTIKTDLVPLITNMVIGISNNITLLGAFTSTPPSTVLNLDNCFLSSPKYEGESKIVAENLALTIDIWVKTAIAVNNSTGVSIFWG